MLNIVTHLGGVYWTPEDELLLFPCFLISCSPMVGAVTLGSPVSSLVDVRSGRTSDPWLETCSMVFPEESENVL